MDEIFAENELFSGLEKKDRDIIMAVAAKKSFPKNTVILSQGDDTHSLYIVTSGKVKVNIVDENGKEIILSILGPGDYFGEMTAIEEGASRSASVVTREKCEVLVLAKKDFRRIISDNPDIVFGLLRGANERIRKANRKIESLALMDVYGRVARLFMQLAVPDGDKLVIQEKLTHQDIANMVGSSREMVSRVMKELTIGNYIGVTQKIIEINGKLPYSW
ncbi:MAG: cyclic nucleotide-binding domain-containing protein [Proteobacteria bacterium]|nr:cyclic nucleotide-binding domain-containing protein [Pseudomonadota bacterium]MBU1736907.1 cyclic nucleotide-binding domain-containing protein [Pseudomonadota bacterium]